MTNADKLVFHRETGTVGVKRFLGTNKGHGFWPKEWGWNFAVIEMDPVTLKELTNWHEPSVKWQEIPEWDSRVKMWKVIKIIEDADWEVNAHCTNSNCDGYEVEIGGMVLNEEVSVFQEIQAVMLKNKRAPIG